MGFSLFIGSLIEKLNEEKLVEVRTYTTIKRKDYIHGLILRFHFQ
jgi:hypothetical protein